MFVLSSFTNCTTKVLAATFSGTVASLFSVSGAGSVLSCIPVESLLDSSGTSPVVSGVVVPVSSWVCSGVCDSSLAKVI